MPLDDVTAAPLPRLPARAVDSHKGDYGRALVVGGSRGMSGAIALAGLATLRSGAGLVTVAVPQSVQDVVASFESSYMTIGLADDNGRIAAGAADHVIQFAQDTAAVALGPGLSRTEPLCDFVERLYREINHPVVIDADALYALARRRAAFSNPAAPRVLTPHPGEFARLSGILPQESQRTAAAVDLARHDQGGNTIVVLKGYQTVVTDGHRFSINQTGNPGMATGGTGDVLTGLITGLLCQGLSPFDAARLGVHVHGLAGDLAAKELGQVSLIASDLIDFLPAAFLVVAQTS
jgi:ADP-dependent NAD(P)H-hydrate dehydratase